MVFLVFSRKPLKITNFVFHFWNKDKLYLSKLYLSKLLPIQKHVKVNLKDKL